MVKCTLTGSLKRKTHLSWSRFMTFWDASISMPWARLTTWISNHPSNRNNLLVGRRSWSCCTILMLVMSMDSVEKESYQSRKLKKR